MKVFFTQKKLKINPILKKGFTIIELIVSTAIIGLIASIVVFNQGDFTDVIFLSNTAHNLALETRKAQIYGFATKEFRRAKSFTISYGVEFNVTNESTGGDNTVYTSFADSGAQNGYYDSPGTCLISECLMVNKIGRGNVISKLCALDSSGTCTQVGRISVTFKRPNADANILFFDASNAPVLATGFQSGSIEITSPKGKKKTIVVYNSGQIAVQ